MQTLARRGAFGWLGIPGRRTTISIPMSDVLSRPVVWVRERWPGGVTLLALALLCWVLARWTWVVIAPSVASVPPPAAAPIDLQAALDDILRARLFSSD